MATPGTSGGAAGGTSGVGDTNLTQNIRDQFLCCKICLDGLKAPKTLPCLHTFCCDCIGYYIEHNRLDSRKFACPICRRHIYIPKNGVVGFPDSFFVASLSDMVEHQVVEERMCGICKFKSNNVEAAVLCVECKIELCSSCGNSHNSAKVTEGHTLLPLEDGSSMANRENYCRVHRGETIKYYCETCNSPICLPCTFLDHKGHNIEEIKDVRSNFSADMKELVLQGKDSIILLTSSKTELVELENELFLRKDQNKTQIRRAAQAAVQAIKEREAHLIAELDAFYDIVNVSRDRQRLERTIYHLERAHNFAEQLLSTDTSPIAQIVNKAEAKESLQVAMQYELPDITVHGAKLDNYAHFLPAKVDHNLGTLLKCCSLEAHTVPCLRPVIPSTKAIYLHSLRWTSGARGTNLGEVFGVRFLPGSEVAVLTNAAKKVRIFDKTGRLKYEFGDEDELLHPSDLAVTADGKIAIADCGLLTIQVFDANGSLRNSFGGSDVFQLPICLTVDYLGKFLVCDQLKQRVTIHRDDGELLKAVPLTLSGGSTGSLEPEMLINPQYIACHANMVYVCDSDNNVVCLYSYRGDSLEFIARLTTRGEKDNDPSTSGQFLDCSGISTDHCGNLLVSDLVSDRLHLVNTRGEMSSLVPVGKNLLRPMCTATSTDGLLAVSQQGVDSLNTETPAFTEVCIYRVVRADV